MQDDLTNEIARVLIETQAATVENRALALHLIIAREVAAQKERDAVIAAKTAAYDDNIQRSAGCGTTGERIAAAIRSAG